MKINSPFLNTIRKFQTAITLVIFSILCIGLTILNATPVSSFWKVTGAAVVVLYIGTIMIRKKF